MSQDQQNERRPVKPGARRPKVYPLQSHRNGAMAMLQHAVDAGREEAGLYNDFAALSGQLETAFNTSAETAQWTPEVKALLKRAMVKSFKSNFFGNPSTVAAESESFDLHIPSWNDLKLRFNEETVAAQMQEIVSASYYHLEAKSYVPALAKVMVDTVNEFAQGRIQNRTPAGAAR